MDSSRYAAANEGRPEAQAEALCEVARVLRPAGRALVTVPYGRYENRGWFVNYDGALWAAGVGASDLKAEVTEYFAYRRSGWQRSAAEDLAEVGYRDHGARGAAGLLCASLRRPA